MPLVSIILPTYNRAKSLVNSINSILNQTFKDFELIIIDDGSKDNTKEVISNFKDSRIIYIRYETNKGQSTARNIGIKNISSDSKYIAFQDSDDVWFKNKLELQIKAFEESPENIGLIFCSYKKIYSNKLYEIIPSQIIPKNGNMYYRLLESYFIGTPTAIIKKECVEKIGGFDESLTYLEDWEFFIRLAKYYKIKFINLPLLASYESKDGITTSVIQNSYFKPILIIFKKHYQTLFSNRKLFEHYHLVIGIFYFLRKDFGKSKKYFKQLFKMRPYNIKYLFYLLISSSSFNNWIFKIYYFITTRFQKLLRFF